MYDILKSKIRQQFDKRDKAVNTKKVVKDDSLNMWLFLMFGFYLQVHLSMLQHYYDYLLLQNPGFLFIIYLLLTTIVALPLNFILIFLGFYTKRLILTFWNCIPIFKGIGFTILFARNAMLIVNQFMLTTFLYIGLAISYFRHTGRPIPTDCNFSEATNSCIPIGTNANFTCKPGFVYKLSAFEFASTNWLKLDSKDGMIFWNNNIVYLNGFLWLALLPLMYIGIRRLMVVYVVVSSLVVLMMIYILYLLKFAVPFYPIPVLKYAFPKESEFQPYHGLHSILYWASCIIFASGSLDAGNMLWLGTMMPENIKPEFSVCMLLMLKCSCVFVYLIFNKAELNFIVHYNYRQFTECSLHITTIAKIFGVLYYMYETIDFNFLNVIIYVLAFTMYTFLETVAVACVVIDSLIDEFPRLARHRLWVCTIICSFNFLFSIILTSSKGIILVSIWGDYLIVIVVCFVYMLITIGLNKIYSLDMIINDFIFTYKLRPSKFVVRLWRISPIVSIFCFSGVFIWIIHPGSNDRIAYICLLLTIAIFLPFAVGFFYAIQQGLQTPDLGSPDKPKSGWGPHKHLARIQRNTFVPHRSVWYRYGKITCTHRCLYKFADYAVIKRNQDMRFREALDEMTATNFNHPNLLSIETRHN